MKQRKSINTRLVLLFLFILSTFFVQISIFIFNSRQTTVIKEISTNLVITRDHAALRSILRPVLGSAISAIGISRGQEQLFSISNGNFYDLFFNRYSADLIVGNKLQYKVIVVFSEYLYLLSILISTLLTLIFYIITDYFRQKIKMKTYLGELAEKLAHDIRSPMSTLQLISGKIENQEIRKLQLNVIKQVNGIATELLDRVDKSDFSANPVVQTVSVLEKMKELESEWNIKAASQKRNIIFVSSNLDENSAHLKSNDFNILYRCINNFIQNSIEATDENEDIYVKLYQAADSRIEITVIDKGIGIPENILNRLGHEKLSHNKISTGHLFSGHGIAIYSAKKDLEKINGTLHITSQPQQGTEIKITLPLASVDTPFKP